MTKYVRMKNEELLIRNIENSIRCIHLGTAPEDTNASYALSKLKQSNIGQYEEYLIKFEKAKKDYIMKLSSQRYIKTLLGTFERVLETKNHIYYVNFEECDENACVKMFNRKRELVSDNYFAYSSFMEDVDDMAIHTWMSDKLNEHINYKKNQEKTRKSKK